MGFLPQRQGQEAVKDDKYFSVSLPAANRNLVSAVQEAEDIPIMADQKDIIKDVVEVLHDGHEGFQDLAEHVRDPQVKAFCVKESQTRSQYASELESVAGLKREAGGTASGAMHRFWGDLKGKMGGGDHTLLETAEQGEDTTKRAYEHALKESIITDNVRQILEKQQIHIKQSHDRVKAFRDGKAA